MVGMAPASRLTVGFLLVGSARAAYSPFTGLEELSPRRMVDFCDPTVSTGVRHCHFKFQKQLEDGGDVRLHWHAKADPDRILSLDTEAAHGVQLIRCTPSSLELILPETHAKHATRGEFVVGSYFVHTCEHLFNVKDQSDGSLEHRNLYHQVTKVQDIRWHGGSHKRNLSKPRYAHVKLWTRELPSLAHMLPSLSFEFEYMPHEAKDVVKWPKTRTAVSNYESEHAPAASAKELAAANARRLAEQAGIGWSWDGGEPEHGGKSIVNEEIDGLLDFTKPQVANFGWNWDFQMNSSKEASFNYSVPGTTAFVMFKKPYIKVHAGIYLKFRAVMPSDEENDEGFVSEDGWSNASTTKPPEDASPDDFMAMWEPHVQWAVQIRGHGVLQARMIVQMLSMGDITQNPLGFIQIPIFKEFERTKWLGTLNFAVGHMPISISPGFQFKAKFFHTGIMRGTVNLGVITHAKFEPKMEFDSRHGLRTDIAVDTTDTTLWPPNWMVSTGHFEFGIALEPTVWLKGWFLKRQQDDTKIALDLRPYMNVSITRHGHKQIPGEELKEAIVYPFRITGLDSKTFNRKYVVKVEGRAGSQVRTLKTKPAMNWGVVEYHDSAADFNFGMMREKELLTNKFNISLIEIDEKKDPLHPVEIGESQSVQISCHSLLNGVCHPSPVVINIPWRGSTAKLYMHMVWQDNPMPWFSQRLRGVSASFPEVILNEDHIKELLPSSIGKDIMLVLVHDSIRYPVSVRRSSAGGQNGEPSPLRGDSILEFGPTFLSAWRPNSSSTRWCDPMLELWLDDQHVGTTPIPEIPWDSQSQMSGTYQTTDASVGHNQVPITVAIKPLSSAEDSSSVEKIAVIRMMFSVANPSQWNRFVAPYKMIEVNSGSLYTLRWSCAFEAQRTFRVSFMKRLPKAADKALPSGSILVGKHTAYVEINGTAKDVSLDPVQSSFNDNQINLFEYQVTLDKKHFAVNDEVVTSLQWVDAAGINHKMRSYPIVILPASAPISDESAETGRGEAADQALGDKQSQKHSLRQLEEAHDLNQDVIPDEHEYEDSNKVVELERDSKPECAKKDLNFAIGAGLLIRGQIEHLSLPGVDIPELQDLADEPSIPLPWKNVFSWSSNEKDLKDILPSLLCRDGACSSTLPGCSQAQSNQKKYYPELHIHWNKEVTYDQSDDAKAREVWESIRKVMAYGFAILPEVLNVVIHALNGTIHHPEPDKSENVAQRHNVQSGEVACEGHYFDARSCARIGCCVFSSVDEACHSAVGQGPCYKEPPTPAPASDIEPAGPQLPVTPLPPTASPDRRLGVVQEATIRFKEGLSYKVDRMLMDELLRRGLFNFDDHDNNDLDHPLHGLHIASYEITEGNAREGKSEETTSPVSMASRTRWNFQVEIILCAIVSVVVLGVAILMLRYRRGTCQLVQNLQVMELSAEEMAME